MKDKKYFLDTNIIVYAHDPTDRYKQKKCQELIFDGIENDSAVISTQVLNEFIVTVTQKITPRFTFEKVMEELETLKILHIQAIDYFHVKTALEIQHSNLISYWDSLIIAAAQTAKCNILYSEDLNNGQTISGVKVVNPLKG